MGPDAPAQSLVGAAVHPDVAAPPSRAPDSRLGMPREESFPRGAAVTTTVKRAVYIRSGCWGFQANLERFDGRRYPTRAPRNVARAM